VAKATLQTIADKVGVSRMTVSNAFSRPDQLSESLRTKILAAADELGYIGPDPRARALARGRTGAVGIVLTETLEYAFTDEVAMELLGAVAAELAPTGLALTLVPSLSSDDLVPVRDVPMDGAIVYDCDPKSATVGWLHKRDLPMVYVDQVPAARVPSVNVDDRGGARAAAAHLLELGHRRFGAIPSLIGAPRGPVPDPIALPLPYASRERVLGWSDVLEPAGAEVVYVASSQYEHDDFVRAARVLLDQPDRPTAVLCFSDAIAAAVLREAEDRGLRVPQDLSVVGFDDNPLARRLRPALTTVRQDSREKGRVAAAALTAAIAAGGSTSDDAEHVLLPAELVVRDSTGPVAADVD